MLKQLIIFALFSVILSEELVDKIEKITQEIDTFSPKLKLLEILRTEYL